MYNIINFQAFIIRKTNTIAFLKHGLKTNWFKNLKFFTSFIFESLLKRKESNNITIQEKHKTETVVVYILTTINLCGYTSTSGNTQPPLAAVKTQYQL